MPKADELAARGAALATRLTTAFTGLTALRIEVVNEDTGAYKTLYTVNGKWTLDESDQEPTGNEDAGDKANQMIWIFESSAGLRTAMRTASHVSAGTDRWVINRRDLNDPSPMEPYWKVYCDHKFS